jgi:hypothetical protein
MLLFFHGFTLQLISRYYYHYFSLLQSTYLLVVPYTALTTRRWRRRGLLRQGEPEQRSVE